MPCKGVGHFWTITKVFFDTRGLLSTFHTLSARRLTSSTFHNLVLCRHVVALRAAPASLRAAAAHDATAATAAAAVHDAEQETVRAVWGREGV